MSIDIKCDECGEIINGCTFGDIETSFSYNADDKRGVIPHCFKVTVKRCVGDVGKEKWEDYHICPKCLVEYIKKFELKP